MERAIKGQRGTNKTAALIVAAGLSSRMGRFKPLLPLGDNTIIGHIVNSFEKAGIEEIVIVVGNGGEDIKSYFKGRGIHFIKNRDYQTTTMFDSAKLGIKYLQGRCSQFFFTPGDIPLFQPFSLKEMKKALEDRGGSFVQPMYKGKHGHPVLFSADCIPWILNHNGRDGLRGAMEGLMDDRIECSLPDKGILMDADTPQDYERVKEYFSSMEIPDSEQCFELLKFYGTDPWVIQHSIAVSEVAIEFTEKLEEAGHILDKKLVLAGALLHDIARHKRNHPSQGAEWLRNMGYSKVANIVEVHMDITIDAIEALDERAIVYLADKLIIEDRRVTLEERFLRSFNKFKDQPEALDAMNARMNQAKIILRGIERLGKKSMEFDHVEVCTSS